MKERLSGFWLILFGIVFFFIGSLIPYYYIGMGLLIQYLILIILLTLGIGSLTLGINLSLKENKKRIGLISFVTSLLTMCHLIIWLWSILNEWSDIINKSWLTSVYLGIFSIATGIMANKKVEKFDKFGLAGLTIAILSLLLTFVYIAYVIFSAPLI